jgi:hypothetical protein
LSTPFSGFFWQIQQVFASNADKKSMKAKKIFAITLLSSWVLGILYTTTKMHGWHWVSFKTDRNPANVSEVVTNNWGMVHVLGQGCSCSQFVAKHLIERGPLKKHAETIVVVGELEQKEELIKAGFKIVDHQDIKGIIQGVPMLLIHNPQKELVYTGGYAPKIITPITKIEDIKIFNAALNGKEELKPYGVMGCAVSKKLQNILDPFKLKYTGGKNEVSISSGL